MGDLHGDPGLQGDPSSAARGFYAGLIGVERQDEILGHSFDQRRMFLRERRAGDGDRIGPSGLVAHDKIHLTFDEDRAVGFADSHLGPVETIKDAGFVEERGLGAVQVFWRFG